MSKQLTAKLTAKFTAKRAIAVTAIASTLALGGAINSQAAVNGKALTWGVKAVQVVNGKTYVAFGSTFAPSSIVSDPYQGDTAINQRRALLCLNKSNQFATAPKGLKPFNVMSPGGSNTYSWSSAKAFAIPDVLGSDLTSQAVADQKCQIVGQVIYGAGTYRMAEFHGGSGTNPGHHYWVEAYSVTSGLDADPTSRYWVRINSTNANPW